MSDILTKLGEKLSAAIHAGDTKEAANLVAQLSNMKLKLEINFKKDELEQRNKEQEFSVRVQVEDRLSDGSFFNLQVKASDTIQDLKRKVMLKHNFPEEVQKWIIGRKIPENENKLSQCGVRGPGHTLYLYLVTARSVGLSKQDFEARRQALYQGVSPPHNQASQSGTHSPVQRESSEQYWPLPPLSPLETQSQNCSNSPSPVSAPSPDLGLGEVDPGLSIYGPTRQTSKKSLTSGSSLLQEMLMAPNPSSSPTVESRQKSAPSEVVGNEVEHWESGYESRNVRPVSTHKPSMPPVKPPLEIEKIGWVCPTCTYINLPVRPGCEMCTGSRPSSYKVPSGYQMTPEERMLLENDQLLEKMTREAQSPAVHEIIPRAPPRPNSHRVTHDQLRENLQLIDALNLRASDSNNNINHRNSAENNQIIGNDFVFVPGGSDWASAQEVLLTASPSFEQRHRVPHQASFGHGFVAAPPSQENQLPRSSPVPNRQSITNVARHAGHLIKTAADDIFPDFPSDDEYS